METGIISSVKFVQHNRWNHPENAERLDWCFQGLRGLDLRVFEPKPHDERILLLAHSKKYVEKVRQACARGEWLDADTYTTPHSFEAGLLAASACVEAVEKFEKSICVVRPPGHHAPFGGFCLFNNAAIAAKHLAGKGRRVFVFDFDYHHGNGTQAILQGEKNAFYCSTHARPAYPGTGPVEDQCENILNIPLPHGTYDELYYKALKMLVEPAVSEFRPDVVVISAGFDSYYADASGGVAVPGLALSTKSYAEVFKIFADHPQHYVLEGGYARESLANGVRAVASLVLGQRPNVAETQPKPDRDIKKKFNETIKQIIEKRL